MTWCHKRCWVISNHVTEYAILFQPQCVNTLRPRQNGRHFADDIFKCICLNENVSILIKISLKFVPKGPINNIPALVQIMAWCRPGNKPLSEPMMVNLPTHICVTRPQWVNLIWLLTKMLISYMEVLQSLKALTEIHYSWEKLCYLGISTIICSVYHH